ncbi:MAG: ABC transporter permease [Jatrophihabitantaceae bacterium]
MSSSLTGVVPVDPDVELESGLWHTLKSVLLQRSALTGLVIVGLFVLSAALSSVISPYSVSSRSCAVFAPPSGSHWLGCDDGGIDVLSLVLHGGAVSMLVGLFATIIAMVVGAGFGILSGYFGGWVDVVLMRITDYFLVIPQIVLMIVIAAVWGPSLTHVIIVIGALMWTGTARVIRAQVMSVRQRVYVKRVEALGASHLRIIVRHIIPQVGPLLVANAVLAITVAIFNETALAFLGLSDPTAITWGTIMEHAFDRAATSAGAWWAIAPAGIAVALFIVGCYLIGRSIEDALNPRLKVSYLSPHSWKMRPLVGRGPDAI